MTNCYLCLSGLTFNARIEYCSSHCAMSSAIEPLPSSSLMWSMAKSFLMSQVMRLTGMPLSICSTVASLVSSSAIRWFAFAFRSGIAGL